MKNDTTFTLIKFQNDWSRIFVDFQQNVQNQVSNYLLVDSVYIFAPKYYNHEKI